MMLRKAICDVVPALSNEGDGNRAEVWFVPDAALDNSIRDIISVAEHFGYKMIPDGYVLLTDEYEEMDPGYLDDRFELIEGE